MSSEKDFKVVIAGGGIAGLALALMLEQFDLDYVVLEGHREIAPAVGASIGMFPNGMRILDQLGCVEQIEEVFAGIIPYKKTYTRDEQGRALSTMDDFFERLRVRFGYGLYFFDRQKLLEIFYDKLEHKERILTQKKVTNVNLVKGGVEVICADGSLFTGTFLVGADGIHSAVRESMTELGHKLQPGYFDPSENDRVPCYYRCSFGIAQHVPNWVPSEQHLVFGTACSQLVISGPDDKVYWFLFEQLPEIKYGKDIPKYTKEDEAEFVKRNKDVPITTEITWGDVYNARISSALTPLHEVVYKKWFFNRIITLGDSCHKPNPIGGQGGNGALESCAVLVNNLLRLKDRRGGSLSDLTDAEIEDIFQETQSTRHERAKDIVHQAHVRQSFFAKENPILTNFINNFVSPLAGSDAVLAMLTDVFKPGARIEKLPVPHKPRFIPYDDELPANIIDDSVHKLVRGAVVGGMGATLFLAAKSLRLPFIEVADWSAQNMSLKWFGNNGASRFFELVTSVLAVPIQDPSARLHITNFLPQLISPILIYTIEGYRKGQRASPLALPSLFNAGMQVQGIARVAPFHAILSAFFWSEGPVERTIPLEVAKSLVPAVTLGFVIPTVMALLPTPNQAAGNHWLGLWQFAPPLVNLFTYLISKGLKKWNESREGVEKKDELDADPAQDLPILKSVYTYAFAIQATAHITTLAYGSSYPGLSLVKTFFNLPNPFSANWKFPSLGAELATFFRYDMVLGVTGYVGSNLLSIWNLRRQGFIKTHEAVRVALCVAVGQFLVGPGATWAGLWYWREDKIAGIAKASGVI
ncbi:unnamed protein product [Clonostachys rhizophaga]|uniref:FAD-binding domain-containing protein n=1 Tax=Clonostachys rhizophaga TaxID=160324 RepID=A0A9N9YL61_9HYPO|nr:unnamed protein product [Clonostachys rhizophaga]